MAFTLPPKSQHHEDPLQPLRAMADRVGKEVEEFAIRLDKWYDESQKNVQAKHKATVQVVGHFRDIAERNVRDLKQQHPVAGKGQLTEHKKNEIRRAARNGDSSEERLTFGLSSRTAASPWSAQELRDWQAELATWELVRVVFDLYHPAPGTDPDADRRAKLAKVGGTDPLCPKNEVWERFIISDDAAREKKVILKWLQQTAKNTENNDDLILEQWAKESGKDINTWTSGWLETKATIKQAKRAQGVEGPLDASVIIHGRDAEKPLVTRLDPDAQTRQKGALEKRDVYYEHALWMVAYEMLRRGESMNVINEWFKERNQGYRAFMLGASGDPRPDGSPNLATPDFGYLHRRATYLAAQGTSYPYEGAALGIVSGNFQTIQAVSSSWDDHLYSYYNALLLARFDKFLLNEARNQARVQSSNTFNFPGVMEHLNGDWGNATHKVVELLKNDKSTSKQAKTPIKLIQGALLTRTLDELVHKVGVAIADAMQAGSSHPTFIVDPDLTIKAATAAGPDGIFTFRGKRSVAVEDYYQAFLQDPHALRILVHLFIILGDSRDPLTRDKQSVLFAKGNVIAAYVEYLRCAQKMQPIPLYAAQMEQWRASMTLARIFPLIAGHDEQTECVKHMKRYGVDAENTILRYADFVLGQTGLVAGLEHDIVNLISRYELRDQPIEGSTASLWPNARRVRAGGSKSVSGKDRAVVQSLKWFDYLNKKDEEMFSTRITKALAIFLSTGHTAAAAHLVEELGVDNELSQFVRLLSLFDQWREQESSVLERDGPRNVLKDTLADMESTFEAILEPDFDPLQSHWWEIYKIYMPEFVLAYISVLQAATWFLKAESFTKAMDLTVSLAERNWLHETFVQTKRIRELMQSIADISASSLFLKKKKGAKMGKQGEIATIWDPNRK
ncbi:hypothetical protein BU23DRAFT_603734 [Bimuria novae-zelandiae CBS 107.79]|uniref:Nuclear pore complex protein n=1 Tax=Bimuria novae-zelandiae CBS 107.79 TaxID=1447943 RepID=A0A6A5UQE1_9PLEO|nr:hypothetical protein BU23DRAFT_603734 [Bimuria novae-zelandiae CBS 107.79]